MGSLQSAFSTQSDTIMHSILRQTSTQHLRHRQLRQESTNPRSEKSTGSKLLVCIVLYVGLGVHLASNWSINTSVPCTMRGNSDKHGRIFPFYYLNSDLNTNRCKVSQLYEPSTLSSSIQFFVVQQIRHEMLRNRAYILRKPFVCY